MSNNTLISLCLFLFKANFLYQFSEWEYCCKSLVPSQTAHVLLLCGRCFLPLWCWLFLLQTILSANFHLAVVFFLETVFVAVCTRLPIARMFLLSVLSVTLSSITPLLLESRRSGEDSVEKCRPPLLFPSLSASQEIFPLFVLFYAKGEL